MSQLIGVSKSGSPHLLGGVWHVRAVRLWSVRRSQLYSLREIGLQTECEIRYNGEEKIVMRLIEVLVTFGLTCRMDWYYFRGCLWHGLFSPVVKKKLHAYCFHICCRLMSTSQLGSWQEIRYIDGLSRRSMRCGEGGVVDDTRLKFLR